ncbi:hypothetical protein pipiens_013005 [Culex pipiens pipiens]|uniref:Uncharacterized protein n=1 Tax=Culex pipiens pipiens TaxID=38569 RepID=A0ABD1D014_CULPP
MGKSTVLTLTLLVIIFLNILTSSDAGMTVQLERIEQIGGEHMVNSTMVRVRKFNRTTFTMNGTGILLLDLDETYEANVKVAYSRLGNNQWNEYPMKIGQKNACQAMVEEYQQYQNVFINNTNLPRIPEGTKKFCPIPKGTYWFRDLAPDASFVPPVVPAGYWRMTLESWRQGELQGVFRMYARLTKGII